MVFRAFSNVQFPGNCPVSEEGFLGWVLTDMVEVLRNCVEKRPSHEMHPKPHGMTLTRTPGTPRDLHQEHGNKWV